MVARAVLNGDCEWIVTVVFEVFDSSLGAFRVASWHNVRYLRRIYGQIRQSIDRGSGADTQVG